MTCYIFVSKWTVFFLYIIGLVGVLFFAKGFFPMKTPLKRDSVKNIPYPPESNERLSELLKEESFLGSNKNNDDPIVKTHFNKLVFVLIDAMRFDFVSEPHYRQHMPYLEKLLNNGHGKLYKSMAKSPTVTLPRLKALLTGTIPGYLDIIFNLDQSLELKEDSFVSSFINSKKNIIFYGDTAWMRLFPSTFLREEGVSSLYVNDYTEVDDNVTRHLDKELNHKNDWDVMILHYIGLDHLGHTVGPSSPLMYTKLLEMDSVLKKIFTSLRDDKNALIVLTSDHGMTAHGGHGGTTLPEIETPLLFLFTDPSFRLWSAYETVRQSDVAATISAMMGTPIPSTSMGCIIPSSLEVFDHSKELHSFQYNCHHLLTLSTKSGAIKEFPTSQHPIDLYRNGLQWHGAFLFGDKKGTESLFLQAKKSYLQCQELLSEKLTSKLASYDYPTMALGVVFLAMSLCLSLILWIRIIISTRHAGVSTDDASRRITRALLALAIGSFLHLATLPGSSFVEEEHQIWHFLTASTCLFIFIAFLRTIIQLDKNLAAKNTSSLYDAAINHSSMLRMRKDPGKNQPWLLINSEDDGNVILNKSTHPATSGDNDNIPGSNILTIKQAYLKYVGVALLAVVAHRLTRAWNQTGIKHADNPDIEDYLNMLENKSLLSITTAIGLFLTSILLQGLCTTSNYLRTILSFIALIGVYMYRASICSVYLPWSIDSCAKGLIEARFVYTCIGLLLFLCIYHRIVSAYSFGDKRTKRRSCSTPRICSGSNSSASHCKSTDCFLSSLIVLFSLLLRPHNQCVLAFNIFIYIIIFRLLWPVVVESQRDLITSNDFRCFTCHQEHHFTSTELVGRVILSYWFGQMAFFTMGNSNSLASVDLSSAYIGLSGSDGLFNYLMAGLLEAFATFAGPILWICMCLADLVRAGAVEGFVGRPISTSSRTIASTLACIRLVSLSVYVAVATGHRYHLFIWSVFSPKLMYEIVSTIVHSFLILVILLLT